MSGKRSIVSSTEPLPVSSETIIWHWLREGWKYRGFSAMPKSYQKEAGDRVKYEMGMIKEKDYIDYFLVMSEVVRHVKDRGLPVGPARGSAAASLVCYLLRITEVNPMDYPLMLFERFIDPTRVDPPDIDLDFDDERRDEVRQHMVEKYGEGRVGNIGTFTRYRGKNAIDDIARVYNIPVWAAEAVKDFLVERSGGDSRFDASIEDTIEMFPQVKAVCDQFPDLYKAIRLEGNLKGFGVHAAGVVVGNDDLTNYVASYVKHDVGKQRKTLRVLSVDKYDGDPLGLMKLDALGLQTMGMIRHAIEMVGMTLDDLYKIPLNDPETLEAFRVADVTGIFQFEGRTMRMVCSELMPNTFMDLAAANALARPGPLHSGSTQEYIGMRRGNATQTHLHPLIDEITKETEGQIIYQEQILQICRVVGDFPWTHASAIRKIISNKKGESAFNAMWKDFRDGAKRRNGIDEDTAREIWKRMVTAGTYAFNIAHCISYSVLGFWCMWLKIHHPVAFYTAQLRKNEGEKALQLMRDAELHGVHIVAPSLNKSEITWTPNFKKRSVMGGFSQIPGIGDKMGETIVEDRRLNGKFDSWDELVRVRGIGPVKMRSISKFCEKDDPFGVFQYERTEASIRRAIRNGDLPCPMPNTYSDQIPYDPKESRHVILGQLMNKNLQDLFENYRSRVGEELDPATVKRPDLKDSITLYLTDAHGAMTVKVNRFAYPKFKDVIWEARNGVDWILARVKKNKFHGKNVSVEHLWVIEPDEEE